MNLLKFFTKEEMIAGIEISDIGIRLVKFKFTDKKPRDFSNEILKFSSLAQDISKKSKRMLDVEVAAEELLDQNIIIGGELKDSKKFIETLNKLIKKTGLKIKYTIVSVPGNKAYVKNFYLPKSLGKEELNEAVKLNVDYQLATNPESVYWDWQEIKPLKDVNNKNEILLSAIPKQIIDSYLEAFSKTDIKIVAVEFSELGIKRILDFNDQKPLLVVTANSLGIIISIFKNNGLRFLRSMPSEVLTDESLIAELKRIVDFYESEDERVSNIIFIPQKPANEKVVSEIEKLIGTKPDDLSDKISNENTKWLTAANSALRGLLPRSEDNLISLTPVGTERAYEYQKIAVFLNFISNLLVGFSILLILIFVGFWLSMTMIQDNINEEFQILKEIPPPTDAAILEIRAKQFNELFSKTGNIVATIPEWSQLFEEIKTRITPGITINNLSAKIENDSAKFEMIGVAGDRIQLDTFEKSLKESNTFANIYIPLTNLELSVNIPIKVTFIVKNQSILMPYLLK